MDECLDEAETMLTRLEVDEGEILRSLELAISLDQDFRKIASEIAERMYALGPSVYWFMRDWLANLLGSDPLATRGCSNEATMTPDDDTPSHWRRRRNLLGNDLLSSIRRECRIKGSEIQCGRGHDSIVVRQAWGKMAFERNESSVREQDGENEHLALSPSTAANGQHLTQQTGEEIAIDIAVNSILRLLSVVTRYIGGRVTVRKSGDGNDCSGLERENRAESGFGTGGPSDDAESDELSDFRENDETENLSTQHSQHRDHFNYSVTTTPFAEWLELCIAGSHGNAVMMSDNSLGNYDDAPLMIPDHRTPLFLLATKAAMQSESNERRPARRRNSTHWQLPGGVPQLKPSRSSCLRRNQTPVVGECIMPSGNKPSPRLSVDQQMLCRRGTTWSTSANQPRRARIPQAAGLPSLSLSPVKQHSHDDRPLETTHRPLVTLNSDRAQTATPHQMSDSAALRIHQSNSNSGEIAPTQHLRLDHHQQQSISVSMILARATCVAS